jgi:5-methylthioadenosine/S-adenosylhomocysteine deaminase
MPHSLATVRESDLREIARIAGRTGLPVHYHANETVSHQVSPVVEEQGIRPIAYADELGVLREQDFIAHGVHLTPEEIDLLSANGASVVHCPASNMKLASGMAPVQELLDAGVSVGIGTDGAASNNDLDMFGEIRDAAMIGKIAADDASAVSADVVSEMASSVGGRVLGFDSGVVAEGMNADLIVVDVAKPHLQPVHDLVSHIAYAVNGGDVRHSVCDGSVLMRDREVVTLDESAVVEAAVTQAEALLNRVY